MAYSIFLKLQRLKKSDFPTDEVTISMGLNGRDIILRNLKKHLNYMKLKFS